jgi:hypothetical protein
VKYYISSPPPKSQVSLVANTLSLNILNSLEFSPIYEIKKNDHQKTIYMKTVKVVAIQHSCCSSLACCIADFSIILKKNGIASTAAKIQECRH